MSEFLQFLFIGLGNGAVYAMIGMGLVAIYRATGLLNFAQGEMAMFSTFFVWSLTDLGLPLWLAVIGGMAGGAVVGAATYQVVVRPVGDPHQKPLAVVIVTIGLFLAFNALAQFIWGTDQRSLDPLFGRGELLVGGVTIDHQKLGALVVLGVEAAVFFFLFMRTKLGLAMRAVASNPESSGLCGVPVSRILLVGWALATAVGTIGGVFMAPNSAVDANLMQVPLIFAFAAITLGGFDSFVGAVVGGLTIGVLTDVVPQYVGFVEKMPTAPAFAAILIVLLIRPQGLFGSARVARV